MSDLSQSLVDAAAKADWQAHNAAVLEAIGKRGSLEDKRQAISRARSRAAVAAVLETLAAHTAPTDPGGPARVHFLNHADFLRLTEEIKEGR